MKKFLSATMSMCLLASAACAKESKKEASNSEANKHQLTAKTGTLLNTEVTPSQAQKAAADTNRQVLQRRSGR